MHGLVSVYGLPQCELLSLLHLLRRLSDIHSCCCLQLGRAVLLLRSGELVPVLESSLCQLEKSLLHHVDSPPQSACCVAG